MIGNPGRICRSWLGEKQARHPGHGLVREHERKALRIGAHHGERRRGLRRDLDLVAERGQRFLAQPDEQLLVIDQQNALAMAAGHRALLGGRAAASPACAGK